MANVSYSTIRDTMQTWTDSKPQIQVHLGLLRYLEDSLGKTISLWKCFCVSHLAYLFRHLEKHQTWVLPFVLETPLAQVASNWFLREWLQPSREVLPQQTVLALETAALRGATKWQWCWAPGGEGADAGEPPAPASSSVTTTWWQWQIYLPRLSMGLAPKAH